MSLFEMQRVDCDLYSTLPPATENPVQAVDEMVRQTKAAIPGAMFAGMTYRSSMR
ncbi:hypothetical protein [Acidisphaera sp. L21]|uniref:hypothetical protein n=1 Tax=Acidisphaera sp. L21 TaxID=1641851 RepID=UPI00131BF7AF|nr:hypothetical protein [Acidisphaera sp. L21]